MLRNDVPFTRDLVLVGGGHAHALVLRAWGMDPLPGARVTVINPGPTAPYTGMLPGHVAGHYGRDDLEIDLVALCQHAGARLIVDRAVGFERTRKEVLLARRGPVAYDVASIDIGITARMDLEGFEEHAIGAKPLDAYAARWRRFLEQVSSGERSAQVAVIGGGVAGCELAMAMSHAMPAGAEVTVIEAGPQISGVGNKARALLLAEMSALGVVIRYGAKVVKIEAQRVMLEAQEPVPAALCVGAAGAFPHAWLQDTDLPLKDGFIEVGPDLGVLGDTHLFAVGDCAHMGFAPRPKAGVFAVRAAPVLHRNLRAALAGGVRKPFAPQKDYLKLISLGRKSAMAEKFGLAFKGPLLWRWKDRIDRAFMERLSDLPVMARARAKGAAALGVREILADKPLCGGCGAKVGSGVLGGVLAALPKPQGEVVAGAGDDAAILRTAGGGFQVISTDHLRGFIADPALMARIAAVHALGDVWAMGATPQIALASYILPQMSAGLQTRTLAEISDAVAQVFQVAGAQVVGGHTTMGAELTIGFTVTGTRAQMPITVAGGKAGDALILTRPIGSGVIMAAHMQGIAGGRDVTKALQVMATPQHVEAAILGDANAMTDVTGFGLAGHVQALARASHVDAVLRLADIPFYDGARALSDKGVASSLMPANRADAAVEGVADPLLFDPQTAGGLLAAIPQELVDTVLRALADKGCRGHVIGSLETGSGTVRVS